MLEISLKQLETFTVTAECASFTRAAEKLHITQSTVSTHIRELEAELDSVLILRGSRRKLELTDAGRQVYAAAKDILNRCEALESIRSAPGDAALSIATSTVPAQRLLPKLMTSFLKKNPNARFALRRGDSDAVRIMLQNGEARIGLMGVQPDPHKFISYPIAQDALIMISANSPRFRALKQRGATGLELIGEPMLAREESSGTQQSVEAYFAACGVDTAQLNIIARMNSPEDIKAGVAQGMGVGAMSLLAAQEEIISGKLISFELGREKAFRTIYIAWRRDAALNAAEQRFAAFVRAETPKLTR